MKISSRSPFLWISGTILSGMLYFFAFHFFPQTFPIVNLSITMDLEQALDTADIVAQKHNLGPDGYEYAAMFNTDTSVKTFVELEAGGNSALMNMIDKKLYMPYTWCVRHFKEYERNEVTIRFTPDGKLYGFVETLSENETGKQLSTQEARTIAENDAAADWNVDFKDYILVESSKKIETSGRIDHIFVYEHITEKIGEGLYRLKIVVSGDKMTEVTHSVKIPESFNRRYAEMRSANTTIAWAANLIMWILYIIGGAGLGLYWIIRQRWHMIRPALNWGFALSLMAVLTAINQLPFLWMHYNSAHSSNGFLMQLFIRFFITLITQTAFFTAIIMAAESLSRRAFGHHLQLWSLFHSDMKTSYAVLGRVIGGYLLVGFNCAFVIGFYLLSTRYLGWWSPSEMLFDPNILATYVPWFAPLAQSLNAGFIEECLFRAIPLAGAALLGNYYGKKNWWIGSALILQAIVFGAAHANYPMQPSYARLIELFIPSLIWGVTYLRFGLLTNIIAHSVYDIIWFSLPIFVSHAPHALAYKVTIILVALFPLIFTAYARIKKGLWAASVEPTLNRSWQPLPLKESKIEPIIHSTELSILAPYHKKMTILAGIVGLAAWVCTTPFEHDGVTITLTKNEAIAQSNSFLKGNNRELIAPWKTLPLVFTDYKTLAPLAMQHKFIWREGNKQLYHNLLGTYLHPAHWTIRYAQFDTDIVERAEEHKVMFYNNNVWRYYHQLAESSAGKQLTHDEARTIAHTTLVQQFGLKPEELTEISATPFQLPQRKNWLFIFSNPAVYPLADGQARINITIAGDEVIDAVRTIHVPEEWERNELNKQNTLNIIALVLFLLLLSCSIGGIALAFRQKTILHFSKSLFFSLLGITTTIFCVEIINTWPSIAGAFNTSLPLQNQLFQFITGLGFSLIAKSIFYALILTFIIGQKRVQQLPNRWITIALGICTGLFFAGILSIAQKLISADIPLWPHYESLACSVPLIACLISAITYYVQLTMTFFFLFTLIDTATRQWRTHRTLFVIFAGLCGMSMLELPSINTLSLWIIIGSLIGLIMLTVYRFIIRFDSALIPLATGSFTVLHLVQKSIFNPYPGAMVEEIISACAVGVLSAAWYWYSNKPR